MKIQKTLDQAVSFRLLSYLILFILACVCTHATAQTAEWPSHLFAPYVDFSAWPPYDMLSEETNVGVHYLSLGFIVADTSQTNIDSATNVPSWGGFTAYDVTNAYRLSDIEEFRALGGDVIVSFGGQSGTELAAYITNAAPLQLAYQYVIDTYSLSRIDFDIEGTWATDVPSINLRSEVIAALQTHAQTMGNRLEVSFTLQVEPYGFDESQIYILQTALSNNVSISTVNIMAMDYGSNYSGSMGTYGIEAATNVFNQLQGIYETNGTPQTDAQLWQLLGITPMIGQNDTSDEITYQTNAQQVVSFAGSNNVGMLGFWSLNRDEPGASGITQTSNQFAQIFLPYSVQAPSMQLTSLARSGATDLLLTWTTTGGTTNWIQSTASLTATNWSDIAGPLVMPGNGTMTTNWTLSGALGSGNAEFYRVRAN